MEYTEQQPLRAIYRPAGGWEAAEEEVEEEPERKAPSKLKAVAFWLTWSVISIPVLTVKGLLEGVRCWWDCLGAMVKELAGK